MKICVISTAIFKVPCVGYSGLEHLAWLTARGLAAKGHQVSLVCPDDSTCEGVEIITVGKERTVDEKMAHDIVWKRLLDFDCVIDETWQKYSYLLKAEGVLKAPILGVLHAPVNSMYQSLPPVPRPCMVCISNDQALHFEGLFGRSARVVYNGVDLSFYRSLVIPRTGRFLFLARFSSIKGPLIAIEACKKLGLGLDLVGDVSITNEPDYFERCKSLCDGKQIRMIGPATRGETVYWYSQAKALLHPNKGFREPFGLAPTEAMACGCPVGCYRYGAMRETVIHGKTGFLADSTEEFVDFLRCGFIDGLDRDACVSNAARFSIESMVSGYEKLCEEALDSGGW